MCYFSIQLTPIMNNQFVSGYETSALSYFYLIDTFFPAQVFPFSNVFILNLIASYYKVCN